MKLIVLLLFLVQGTRHDSKKPDLVFLKNLSPKDQVQKLIDTSAFLTNKEPDVALTYLENCYELVKKFPNANQEKDIYLTKARIFLELSDFKQANEYIQKAFNFHKELNNDKFLIQYYSTTGGIFYYQTNFSKAVEYFSEALKVAEKAGDYHWIGTLLNNIGNIYMYCNINNDAMNYYKRAMSYSRKINDYDKLAVENDNIGQLYNSMGNYKESLKYLWEANRLYKKQNNQIYYFWNFTYLADTYKCLGDIKNAEKYFNLSLEKSRKYNHSVAIAEASVGLGNLYFLTRRYDEAFKILKGTEPLALENRNYVHLTDIYKTISDIYKLKNDFKNSLDYFIKYSTYKDSVSTYDIQKKAMEIDIKYNMEKKDHELLLLKKDKQLNELNLSRANTTRNYIIAFFVLAVLSLGIILVIKLRSVKKLHAKQEVINKQNEELESTNKSLIEYQAELQNLNRDLELKVSDEVKKREAQQMIVMQKSKLESLGILSAGIAHEINQPLTSISFSLENLIYKRQTATITDEYMQSKFTNIETDIRRITNIINHIRVFAREQGEIKFERFDLNDVINNSQLMVNAQLRNNNIYIDLVLLENSLWVTGNKYRLEQVLLNLILNSKYAVEKKEIRADNFDFQKKIIISTFIENGFNCFSVEDNGIGIPPEVKEKVFEPFFTTKETDAGTGLGLSIVYGIIKEHKGEIVIDSVPDEYTKFTVKIPSLN